MAEKRLRTIYRFFYNSRYSDCIQIRFARERVYEPLWRSQKFFTGTKLMEEGAKRPRAKVLIECTGGIRISAKLAVRVMKLAMKDLVLLLA
jgi:hypothetical protein